MENYNRSNKDYLGIYYYLNDKLHRTDGPACELYNGSKFWYQYGELHRIDGPAEEYSSGIKYWYYEGRYITNKSQEEFERYIKLKLFW